MQKVHDQLSGVTAWHDRNDRQLMNPKRCNRMITTIGTPASQRAISRSIVCLTYGIVRRVTAGPKLKRAGSRVIAMVATLLSGPPGGRQRDQKADCSNEAS